MKRLITTLCVSFALTGGCEALRTGEPVTARLGGQSLDDQLEFWHTLNTRPLTSNDDALHGLILYFNGQDAESTFPGRVQRLKRGGLLPSDFKGAANEAVERGTVAYAMVKGLHIRGGWVMFLLGPTPRYAIRELEYKGLFPPSSPQQPLSGAEFVGIIGRIEDYQHGNPTNAPATELPGDAKQNAGGGK